MPTTTPLTDAIQALTTYANETTGASDTDLSSAVASLVAGYGGGGGADFETGALTGDGVASTSYRHITVSKRYSHFIMYISDQVTFASGDCTFCYGTPSLFLCNRMTGSTNSATTWDTRGVYLKFYDNKIDVMPAANGNYAKLHNGATYSWIAWND